MKLVVDMCLPPELCKGLTEHGHDAVHWSRVGDPTAQDDGIMLWAVENDRLIA